MFSFISFYSFLHEICRFFFSISVPNVISSNFSFLFLCLRWLHLIKICFSFSLLRPITIWNLASHKLLSSDEMTFKFFQTKIFAVSWFHGEMTSEMNGETKKKDCERCLSRKGKSNEFDWAFCHHTTWCLFDKGKVYSLVFLFLAFVPKEKY